MSWPVWVLLFATLVLVGVGVGKWLAHQEQTLVLAPDVAIWLDGKLIKPEEIPDGATIRGLAKDTDGKVGFLDLVGPKS